MFKKIILVVCGVMMISAAQAQVTGAGATFPYPVYAKWADAYKKETGIEVNYQSVGSGAGIKQIQARTVVFGATDAPLNKAQLDKSGLVQFPTVIGGNVLAVNIPGIKTRELVLNGELVADIYLGKIRSWDDPRIRVLNPNLNLPKLNISVVRRSDGSGTTFIFTNYLSKVSTEWQQKVGAGTAVEWPVGVGARGNEGVAGNVTQTRGSIGYMEYAYAKQNNLAYTLMVNAAGQTVAPSIESFSAAALGDAFNPAQGYNSILTNQKDPSAWPIAGATFILMPRKSRDPAAAQSAIRFFLWAYEKGDNMATELDYVPLPDSVVSQIQGTMKEIN
jgi:phosphate transport system substrate-binding protein